MLPQFGGYFRVRRLQGSLHKDLVYSGMTNQHHIPWWGDYRVDEGTGGKWEIGPSTLWLLHRTNDWVVVHRPFSDEEEVAHSIIRSTHHVTTSADEIMRLLKEESDACNISRYSFKEMESDVSLKPALADRPIISRPEHSLFVPAGESVTLYLSTPLWIQVWLTGSGRRMTEFPSFRMSDTWFGPSTLEGEICYATRTSGRLLRDRIPVRLNRAITPLRIFNSGNDPLQLVRVQLPAPHLSLFQSASNELWTDAVTMTRSDGAQGAEVEIVSGAPEEVKGAKRIAGPRLTMKKGLFTSTFGTVGSLLSH